MHLAERVRSGTNAGSSSSAGARTSTHMHPNLLVGSCATVTLSVCSALYGKLERWAMRGGTERQLWGEKEGMQCVIT